MKRKRLGIMISGAAIILCIGILLWYMILQRIPGVKGPTLYFSNADFTRGGEVTVDVKVAGLQGSYPAASFQIDFDQNKLEFLEIKQGNVPIENQKSGETFIPEWNYNKEHVNHKGTISTMYLDMTGEDNPISGEQLSKENDVLFRVTFRVKDSCNIGEKEQLTFQQATFAAIEDQDTLTTYKNNLYVKAGSYTVAE